MAMIVPVARLVRGARARSVLQALTTTSTTAAARRAGTCAGMVMVVRGSSVLPLVRRRVVLSAESLKEFALRDGPAQRKKKPSRAPPRDGFRS